MQRFSKYSLFSLLFFVSGFAGIIYESVWTQYLKIITGHAAFAQSFILVIFLAGMSAGSWLAGKWSPKIRNLFFYYALAELIIGIAALLFHSVFIEIKHLIFDNFYPNLPAFSAKTLKWLFAALITFPQSILLGATFPLLAGGISRKFPQSNGRIVAQLYFINSLGASIGILISGYYLISFFGLPGTMLFAGFLNFFISIIVFVFSGKSSTNPVNSADHQIADAYKNEKKIFSLFLIASIITGATSFMYEIGWIRMLSMVLGSSVQSFELMLSAFILGLAIGSYIIKFRIDRLHSLFSTFSAIQILMGLFAILSLVLYNHTFNFMEWLLGAVQSDSGGYRIFTVSGLVISYAIMLPATICAGMTLPLLVKMAQNAGMGEQSTGKIFAADTAGGILGVILAFHFLMPQFGLKFLIIFAGILDVGLGIWFLFRFDFIRLKKSLAVFVVLAFAIMAFGVFFKLDTVKMASGVYRYGIINRDNKILFHKDGKTATIDVFETKNGNIVLSTNGKPDASINLYRMVSGDLTTQTLLAALPYSINDQYKNAAIIGLGSGKTAHVALMNYNLSRLDVIDIEPAVADATTFFREQVQNIYNDTRYMLHIADAKSFFAYSKRKYELIISEPSNPWISGVGGLFSYEFFQTISKSLTDQGILVQWLHTYEMNMALLASVIKAISPVFEDYRIFFLDDGDLAIVAKKNGIIGDVQEKIFENPEMEIGLKRLGIESKNDFLLRFVGDKQILDPLFDSYAVDKNSDYHPYLEYNAGKVRFLMESADELKTLVRFPAPILRSLQGLNFPDNFETGPDYTFEFAKDHRNAREIFNYFSCLSKGERLDISGLDEYHALLLNTILKIDNEVDPDVLEKIWVPFLEPFAEVIMPFLSADELDEIWLYIQKAKGYNHLSENVRSRIDLYQAAGEKDYPVIIRITNKFLLDQTIAAHSENMYYLSLAMWANLMTDNPVEAITLWERYQNDTDPPVLLRFLSSLAKERVLKKDRKQLS